jgi:hypothetical protein
VVAVLLEAVMPEMEILAALVAALHRQDHFH